MELTGGSIEGTSYHPDTDLHVSKDNSQALLCGDELAHEIWWSQKPEGVPNTPMINLFPVPFHFVFSIHSVLFLSLEFHFAKIYNTAVSSFICVSASP